MTVLAEAIEQSKLELAQKCLVDVGADREIAWAAGFLEGEGCFQWAPYPGRDASEVSYGSPRVHCGQADLEPLNKLVSLFGGSIKSTKSRPNRKPFWEWRVGGADAMSVMDLVYGYMTTRRQEKIDEIKSHWLLRLDRVSRCTRGHLKSESGAVYQSGPKKGRFYCRRCVTESSRLRRGRTQP